MEGGEHILDFRVEAEQSLKEVAYAIQEGGLSESLASSSSCAYINLTTKEGRKLTVRLSMRGFEVVGHSHNNTDIEKSSAIKDMYETIYALLEHISPSYVLNFADAVASKLQSEINALSDET